MYQPDSTDPTPIWVSFESGGIVVEPSLGGHDDQPRQISSAEALDGASTRDLYRAPVAGHHVWRQSLANFYKTNYWVYWKSANDENVIQLSDTLYGEAAACQQRRWHHLSDVRRPAGGVSARFIRLRTPIQLFTSRCTTVATGDLIGGLIPSLKMPAGH